MSNKTETGATYSAAFIISTPYASRTTPALHLHLHHLPTISYYPFYNEHAYTQLLAHITDPWSVLNQLSTYVVPCEGPLDDDKALHFAFW